MPLTDTELLDALSALLHAQFEDLLVRANVPAEYLPSGIAAPTERALAVVRWVQQDPTSRRPVVESALREVHGVSAPRGA